MEEVIPPVNRQTILLRTRFYKRLVSKRHKQYGHLVKVKGKGKSDPLQAWSGPEGLGS